MRRTAAVAVLLVALAAFGAGAEPTEGQQENSAVYKKLRSANPDDVMYAVQALGASGSKAAVGPLTELLLSGPKNEITNGILQALGTIGHPHSMPILIEYLEHRRPDARVAAIYALESYSDERVTKALESTLGDSDAEVRSTAALALGKRKSTKSVAVLFKAFERGVNDAVISIGQLGGPADGERLAGFLGKADIKVLLPGFDEFLRRPEFPEEAKLSLLNHLLELAGPDVKRFVVGYKASFPPGTDPATNKVYRKVWEMEQQIQED